MKIKSTIQRSFALLLSLGLTFFVSCSQEDDSQLNPENEPQKPVENTGIKAETTNASVMMQAFYWDVPAGGTWWDVLSSKTAEWSNAGFNAIWLPPASKAQNGTYSMGYDPYDYFDFGEFDQMGSVETRFGSRSELVNLISSAHQHELKVYADIVINHNSGGASQENPYTGNSTWTGFQPLSGMFPRSYDDFHPNDLHQNDRGSFGGFPDLCHDKPNVQNWLWKSSNSVAQYYKNEMGFDGWRFDYVKGFEPWVVREWVNTTGGFSVGELWDGNVDYLNWWANEANSSVFDFACYYAMNDAFDGKDLTKLNNDMMWKRNPFQAVTFVTNHDTDEIWNKMLAYAYILTHEGYPCVFYRDYEEWLNKDKMNNLIWIHNHLASGNTTILYSDNDEYVARRNGYNGAGLIVYINNSDNWQERWVETNWSNTRIKDYTGNSNWEPVTQEGKWVKIQVPPKGYSVWSVK
jgi:alpha-amylase